MSVFTCVIIDCSLMLRVCRSAAVCFVFPTVRPPLPVQEAASLSMEAGLGGGRSLLQYRGGYKQREREREERRRMKERAEVYKPVEFKVE